MPRGSRVYRPTGFELTQIRETREVVQRSREVLDAPIPDTFLGRVTQPTQMLVARDGLDAIEIALES